MSAPRRRVYGALALFGFAITLLWSIVMPNFTGPDELLHLDLVHEISTRHSYPLTRHYLVHQQINALRTIASHGDRTLHHGLASQAPKRGDRPSWNDVDGRRAGPNQLTQHPPLGWLSSAVAIRVAAVFSEPTDWPYDVYMFVMRFFNALLMAPVGPLLYASVRRLGRSHQAGIMAALLVFAVPQLTYLSGVISNDALVVTIGAVVAYVAARILSGDDSRRTAIWFGLVIAAAMLTKAWGLLLLPFVPIAYALASGRDRARWRTAAVNSVMAVAVPVVLSGWWWIRNVIDEGTLQPQRAPLPPLKPGFRPIPGDVWYPKFASWMVSRFWGWFGTFAEQVRLPIWVVVVATATSVVGLTAAVVLCKGPVRKFAVFAVGFMTINTLAVMRGAHTLHLQHGGLQGIQGRYVFMAVPLLAVSVACGFEQIAGRHRTKLPVASWAAVVVMQGFGLFAVFSNYWGSPGASVFGRMHALAAWSPLPPVLFVVFLFGIGAVVVATPFAVAPRGESKSSPRFVPVGADR